MKKKEIKKTKLKPRTKAEVKRDQYTVVLEDVRRQFGVIKEGFSGVNKRFDRLDKKVDDNHRETNDNFKTLFKFRNEMMNFKDETKDNFKVNFEYLSKIDDEVQSIKEEMAEMRNNIINGERIDPVKFFEIERRVGVVEKKLNITAI